MLKTWWSVGRVQRLAWSTLCVVAGCSSEIYEPSAPQDGGVGSDASILDASAPVQVDAGHPAQADAGPEGIARIQILGFNDFHGNIEPPAGSSGSVITGAPDGGVAPSLTAGGAAYFARHVAALRAQNPHTVVVSAGDLVGASPLVSALFHDEPTVEAMNLIGLDINAVGNHEFDEGKDELVRLASGGCHPTDGCQDGTPFAGASFQMLSANVFTQRDAGSTLFDRYTIRELDGVPVAFIGMTLEGTPSIVTPSGISGLTFADEADTVNALVPELRARGVKTIVVVIHEGGFQPGLFDECVGISGEIVNIAQRLDDEVDLVISGHTHAGYNCVIDGKRVTSALSFGRLITQVELEIDRVTQEIRSLRATNRVVTRDVEPVVAVSELVSNYAALAAPLRDREVGTLSAALTRPVTPSASNAQSGESTLGRVIADAQRAATRDPASPLPHVAFMNPGGIRADLDAGPVTYGEAFTVQPFGNSLVVMTLTGAQLRTLLEQQFQATATRILQPSGNLTYSWDFAASLGAKVQAIEIDGEPLADERAYRVTVNSFLATGGDGFTVLNEGTARVGGDIDVDAFERYLTAQAPLAPPTLGRIVRIR